MTKFRYKCTGCRRPANLDQLSQPSAPPLCARCGEAMLFERAVIEVSIGGQSASHPELRAPPSAFPVKMEVFQ